MTFREKIAQAVAEKLFHNGTGIFTASSTTLVITKYKKKRKRFCGKSGTEEPCSGRFLIARFRGRIMIITGSGL